MWPIVILSGMVASFEQKMPSKVFLSTFPGVGQPTMWSRLTNFVIRKYYHHNDATVIVIHFHTYSHTAHETQINITVIVETVHDVSCGLQPASILTTCLPQECLSKLLKTPTAMLNGISCEMCGFREPSSKRRITSCIISGC